MLPTIHKEKHAVYKAFKNMARGISRSVKEEITQFNDTGLKPTINDKRTKLALFTERNGRNIALKIMPK